MKQFETVERCGRTYVVRNGVESESFIEPGPDDDWLICHPTLHGHKASLEGALAVIAGRMGAWYTVAEAAVRLVELSKADLHAGIDETHGRVKDQFYRIPSTQTMYRWLRAGQFPGAIKIEAVGRGGSWRIPEAALEFRKGGEKE